jgi:hypothetical protein
MPSVFSQMNCYGVGPAKFSGCRSPNRIRFDRTPCLTNSGYMVNIHTERGHGHDSFKNAGGPSLPAGATMNDSYSLSA